jgi:hypothetical protein
LDLGLAMMLRRVKYEPHRSIEEYRWMKRREDAGRNVDSVSSWVYLWGLAHSGYSRFIKRIPKVVV